MRKIFRNRMMKSTAYILLCVLLLFQGLAFPAKAFAAEEHETPAAETVESTPDKTVEQASGGSSAGSASSEPAADAKEEKSSYRVIIHAVDSKTGAPLTGAKITMERSLDARSWGRVSPDSPDSPGVYTLDVKDKVQTKIYVAYRFDVMMAGYTPYAGSVFNFNWSNAYFNPHGELPDPISITIPMESKDDTLEKAKEKGIRDIQDYEAEKGPDHYRDEERAQLEAACAWGLAKVKEADSVSSVEYAVKTAKERMDRLKTRTEYENEEYTQRIYFKSSDGKTVIRPDKSGVITLTALDAGSLYITRPDGSVYANDGEQTEWRCKWKKVDPDTGDTEWSIVIGYYGQYTGAYIGEHDGTVYLSDVGRTIRYKIKIVPGNIDRLRASVDGKDVSNSLIRVNGSEKKTAVIEGHYAGTDRWVRVPRHALKMSWGGATRVNTINGEFRTWGKSGYIQYSLTTDPLTRVKITIHSNIVKPKSIQVEVPKVAYVDDWNGAHDCYVGIREGAYRVKVSPENRSDPSVTWEALDPDVATFREKHSLGIVPKKAGTARFRITCNADKSVSTTVRVNFKYRNPLKSARAEKNVYYATVGDGPIHLTIITNGQRDSVKGATEQRFTWFYSIAGVASVRDTVKYDPSSVTIPRWVEHSITIGGPGVVDVTGIPYDTSGNCPPVRFKVVVSRNSSTLDRNRAAVERVERMINAIGEVTLEKKGQIEAARAAFNALTDTQKDMVDDAVYAKLVAAELRLQELERLKDMNGGGGNVLPPSGEDHGGSDSSDGGDPGGGHGAGNKAGTAAPDGRQGAGIEKTKATERNQASVKPSGNPNGGVWMHEIDLERKTPGKIVKEKKIPAAKMLLLLFIVAGLITAGAVDRYRKRY
ncbi:MAG: hypothetical protein PUB39_05975 [Eubacteriales bacterium]|nr:hypothetical protein [Eubacteriales bacterium]